MTIGSVTSQDPLERRQGLIQDMYGDMIGRHVEDVPTPALLLDLAAAERNIARMATALETMPAEIRPHIKVHKSVDLAARQVAAGAIGLSTATVWEAVALAWAGLDNLFVVNTVAHPEKIRVLAELARGRHVLVAVDEAANAAELSAAAAAAGSQLGVLIEVDTGMDRAGVDTEEDAIALAKEVVALDHLRLEGITGYEGHCSLEFDPELLVVKQRAAMDMFLQIAERMESLGIPCPVRSAGGTVTWKLTAERPGVTEIQAGTLCPHGQLPRPQGARRLRACPDGRHDRDQPGAEPPDRRRGQQVDRCRGRPLARRRRLGGFPLRRRARHLRCRPSGPPTPSRPARRAAGCV